MAAENGDDVVVSPEIIRCFNEAAAHGRGKRGPKRNTPGGRVPLQ